VGLGWNTVPSFSPRRGSEHRGRIRPSAQRNPFPLGVGDFGPPSLGHAAGAHAAASAHMLTRAQFAHSATLLDWPAWASAGCRNTAVHT